MQARLTVQDAETLALINGLAPDVYMAAWATAIKQLAEKNLRTKIGGDFGNKLADEVVQVDRKSATDYEVYVGGTNGYIAEHVHTGGVIRPKNTKFLAIPIDKSVKGLFAREVPGLIFLRSKADGPNGRCYLAKPMKTKVKPLFVLKRSVMQAPRPWWPSDADIDAETKQFFEDNF